MGATRRLFIIGIGAGDPEFMTMQAVAALNQVDVFFFIDKPNATGDLATLRAEICHRFITDHPYRVVHADEVERDRRPDDYGRAVTDWHEQRADLYERLIRDELGPGQVGAFLAWGDPGLYDGTSRIVDQVLARGGVGAEYTVIPGVSSVQVLAAAHRVPLNRTGEAIEITTGRRITTRTSPIENTFVMLDADCAFRGVDDPRLDIYWGAYLGTPDEVLIHGPLDEVGESIAKTRAELRAKHGWIMDTYLLRRRRPS